jgi:hypothetical protein
MNNKNIREFFNDLLLDKFLVNFFPGLILFYVLTTFIKFSTGDGLLSLLIIVCTSWILGIFLEMIFYGKTYRDRRTGKVFSITQSLNLLFSKIGLSIIITAIITLVVLLIQLDTEEVFETEMFTTYTEKDREIRMFLQILKPSLCILFGIFLYRRYPQKNTTTLEE